MTFVFCLLHTEITMRACLVYVRPTVEYNSTVWPPLAIRDTGAVE